MQVVSLVNFAKKSLAGADPGFGKGRCTRIVGMEQGIWGAQPPEAKTMSHVSGLKIKCTKWFSAHKYLNHAAF